MQDAARLERRERRGHVDRIVAEQTGELVAVKLAAEHRGDLHHPLALRAEPIEPSRDDFAHGAGDQHLFDRARERGLPVVDGDVPLLEQRPRDLFGEERTALCLGEDPLLEVGRQRPGGDGTNDRPRMLVRKWAQRELGERHLRAPRGVEVRPVAEDHHHPRLGELGYRELDHLARGIVDPMEVFDDQHDRCLLAHASHQVCQGVEGLALDLVRRQVGAGGGSDREQPREERIHLVEARVEGTHLVGDLFRGACRRIRAGDREVLSQHDGERRVGDLLFERRAAALEERDLGGQALLALEDQP